MAAGGKMMRVVGLVVLICLATATVCRGHDDKVEEAKDAFNTATGDVMEKGEAVAGDVTEKAGAYAGDVKDQAESTWSQWFKDLTGALGTVPIQEEQKMQAAQNMKFQVGETFGDAASKSTDTINSAASESSKYASEKGSDGASMVAERLANAKNIVKDKIERAIDMAKEGEKNAYGYASEKAGDVSGKTKEFASENSDQAMNMAKDQAASAYGYTSDKKDQAIGMATEKAHDAQDAMDRVMGSDKARQTVRDKAAKAYHEGKSTAEKIYKATKQNFMGGGNLGLRI